MATFGSSTQALWINGVQYQTSANFTPQWGISDLRFGATSTGGGGYLDGYLGGYVAILDFVPSEAYVRASYKDFLLGTFAVFGTIEP